MTVTLDAALPPVRERPAAFTVDRSRAAHASERIDVQRLGAGHQ